MSLPDADRHARERIEYHREQMGAWKRARAERIAADRLAGKSVEDIAAELRISAATVYQVLRAAPHVEPEDGKPRRGRPRKPS